MRRRWGLLVLAALAVFALAMMPAEEARADEGHVHGWGEWTYLNEQDHYHQCTVCSFRESEAHVWSEYMDIGNGMHSVICPVCGAVKPGAELVMHRWGEWEDAGVGDNHRHTCLDCGAEETKPHNFNIGVFVSHEPDGHYFNFCDVCGWIDSIKPHTWNGLKPNGDGTHTLACDICDEISPGAELEPCDWGTWEYENADVHIRWCNKCRGFGTEAHDWSVYRDNGNGTHSVFCPVCGAVKPGAEPEMHRWGEWEDTGDGSLHRHTCQDCGAEEKEPHGNKYMGDYFSLGPDQHYSSYCDLCGAILDAKPHEWNKYVFSGDGTHYLRCNCGEELPGSTEPCVWGEWTYLNEQKHYHRCTLCGFREPEAHDWSAYLSNGDGTHSLACSVCGAVKPGAELEMHRWGEWEDAGDGGNHRHTCQDCGTVEKEPHVPQSVERCTSLGPDEHYNNFCDQCGAILDAKPHRWNEYLFSGDGTHFLSCADCGEELPGSTEPCVWGKWTYLNEQKHYHECTVCDNLETEAHDWWLVVDNRDGTHTVFCSVCGAAVEEHDWSAYEDNGNGTHRVLCSVCGAEKPGASHVAHGWGEWEDAGDSTNHRHTCQDCGAVEKKPHNEKDLGRFVSHGPDEHYSIVCDICGAILDAAPHSRIPMLNGDGTHSFACGTCGEYFPDSEPCVWGEWTYLNEQDHYHQCTVCSFRESEAHVWSEYMDIGNGMHSVICPVCGAVKPGAELEMHRWGEWEDTGDGVNHRHTCLDCGAEETKPHNFNIGVFVSHEPDGHYFNFCDVCGWIDSIKPHTWNGLKPNGDGTHTLACDICDEISPGAEPEPCDWGTWKYENADVHIRWCNKCRGFETEAHDWSVYRDNGDGTHSLVCSGCGAVKPGTEPEEHRWGEWADAADGVNHRHTCMDCGAEEKQPHTKDRIAEADADEHGWACDVCGTVWLHEAHTRETLPAVEPTCTATGLTEGERCSVCEEILTAQDVVEVNPDAHPADKIMTDVAVESTCTETGLTAGTHCDACGAVLLDQQVIPATGHAYGEWRPGSGRHTATCAHCRHAITAACTMIDVPSADPEAAPVRICPVCGAREDGEPLARLRGAKAAAGAPRGTLSVFMAAPAEDAPGILVFAFVRNGAPLPHSGEVTFTLPAAAVEGLRLTAISPDGTEIPLPVETDGKTATFTLTFAPEDAEPIPAAFVKIV